ncbi:hypothetical protein GM415_16045 [Pseudodesulfovibrio cashew]|uniref:Uncharacterized protein n=1 Tax=Pseudodesulfovibrio cashew TaxID=2678688 RepID=A0A6I6JKR9_9BACT|nr:hypothetical protein [Pseudodesulfovibrio cashew]QGY41568.1 hypothetical protein GM415_16045 [Pseudodesulfovibrio cashew]
MVRSARITPDRHELPTRGTNYPLVWLHGLLLTQSVTVHELPTKDIFKDKEKDLMKDEYKAAALHVGVLGGGVCLMVLRRELLRRHFEKMDLEEEPLSGSYQ